MGVGPIAPGTSEHGLKANAIGFTDALVIGLNSTAPACSLAAVIGLTVVAVGVQAPAVLLASFIPMFFIAGAFFYIGNPRGYFERRGFESVDPAVASGRVVVPETAGAPAGD